MSNPNGNHDGKHQHYILPEKKAFGILVLLLILTAVTVWASHIDFGSFNILVAIIVASIKGTLVALFFMNLKHDEPDNGMIFGTSFIFLAIFVILTITDLFARGDVYTDGKPLLMEVAGGKAKFTKPWEAKAEMLEFGKKTYAIQCASCHGDKGDGMGPAAGALNPKPRNFTAEAGWKNGRKASQVFKTLTEGLGGMPSFKSLPGEDRWALAHYVRTLGPQGPADTAADLAAVGVDPSKGDATSDSEKSIPVDFAIKRIAEPNN